MHIILYLFLTLSILQAQSIDNLIKQSLKKHPSLHAIEHRLSAMNERIEASQNFSNPDII